jgi:hypothetical protein
MKSRERTMSAVTLGGWSGGAVQSSASNFSDSFPHIVDLPVGLINVAFGVS